MYSQAGTELVVIQRVLFNSPLQALLDTACTPQSQCQPASAGTFLVEANQHHCVVCVLQPTVLAG